MWLPIVPIFFNSTAAELDGRGVTRRGHGWGRGQGGGGRADDGWRVLGAGEHGRMGERGTLA